jgi:hypothetical protein
MTDIEIFNFRVNRARAITIACYVLHTYFEMWKIPKLGHLNEAIKRNNFAESIGCQLWRMENK